MEVVKMKVISFLRNILSLHEDKNHLVLCLCGIKFKFRLKKSKFNVHTLSNKVDENRNVIFAVKSDIINEIKALNTARALHNKTFGKYKNCHAGKEVVLVATGPTLNEYIPIEKAIHVGVNRAYMFDKITFDFLFMQDYLAVKNYIEDSINYKNKEIKRFYGLLQPELVENWVIPESYAIKHKAERYYARSSWAPNASNPAINFTYDISSEPLICHGSVVFPAMQFILYTNPSKIYIVGCDCSTQGYFNGPPLFPLDPDWMYRWWKELKSFAQMYYPETEIISVNPVGLKGLFTDLYQLKDEK